MVTGACLIRFLLPGARAGGLASLRVGLSTSVSSIWITSEVSIDLDLGLGLGGVEGVGSLDELGNGSPSAKR